MWIRKHSKVYPGVSKETVWRLWSDIDNWMSWHDDLDSCKLNGEFVVGSHFVLKPKGGLSFKIKLVEIKEGRKFTDCTQFIGAKMYDSHEMEETSEGLRLTNTLKVTGWLKFLWIKLVAQKVADSVPQEVAKLVELARREDG